MTSWVIFCLFSGQVLEAEKLLPPASFGAPVKTSESKQPYTPALETPFAATIFAYINAARSERLP